MSVGSTTQTQQLHGLGDDIVATKDFSQNPTDNSDRVKKLGRTQSRPFGMVLGFDRSTKLRATPDGYGPDRTVKREGGTGTRTQKDRSIIKLAEPDNWMVRDQSPMIKKDEASNRDQVHAIRLVTDRQNPEWKRPNRSTYLVTQQKFQMQAGVQNALWVKLVPTRGNKREQDLDSLAEETWATGRDRFSRVIKHKTEGLFTKTKLVFVGFDPDDNGDPTVPVFQPQTTFHATPQTPQVPTGGGPVIPGGGVSTVALPKDFGRIDSEVVGWPSGIINLCASGGYAGGFPEPTPKFVSTETAVLGTGAQGQVLAMTVGVQSGIPEPQATYAAGRRPHIGQLAHVVAPIKAPWLARNTTGDSDPEDAVDWGALGIRCDAYLTSPRDDIFGPLSINPLFWDRPQFPDSSHHSLGDLYWSNLGTVLRGPRFAGDPNANTKEIDRPPTPWRLRSIVRGADTPAYHLPPNLFKGNFEGSENDPLPMGARRGLLGPGISEVVAWRTRKASPATFSSPHGSGEYLAQGLRLAAHLRASTGLVDEVAAHMVVGSEEFVEKRAISQSGPPAADNPATVEFRRQQGALIADRLQRIMIGSPAGLAGAPLPDGTARLLAAAAADVLRDIADLQSGRDAAGSERRLSVFSDRMAEALKLGSSPSGAKRFRRVPFLPPASPASMLPAMPANPSGVRLADALQQMAVTINALVWRANRERARVLADVAEGTSRDTSGLIRIRTAGAVAFYDGIGEVIEDPTQFFWDKANDRLGLGTAAPGQRLDVASGRVRVRDLSEKGILYSSSVTGLNNTLASDPAELHWDDAVKRMGIGTNAPETRLSTKAGTGTALARADSGMIHVDTGTVGSDANTMEKTLMEFALPANSFDIDGRGVRIRAWGTTALNGTAKTIRLYFGATVVAVNDMTVVPNGVDWLIYADVFRSGVGAQESVGNALLGNVVQSVDRTAPAEDETAPITIKVTFQAGIGAAANDGVAEGLAVEYL